jgi:aryl-alcohol dehydrogenase (NADP+)
MLGVEQARPIIKRAIDLGINFFDTAVIYSKGKSEEILGEIVADYRDQCVIATKLSPRPGYGLSRSGILSQMEGSLARLRTDHVDLCMIHRWDYNVAIEEVLATLNGLIQQRKTRYIGASSMYAWQFEKALWASDRLGLERFEAMQNLYNLCYREEEREMIPLCHDQGIALTPYSPLARGFLTGKYKADKIPDSARYRTDKELREFFFRPEDFAILKRVEEVAAEQEVAPAVIALAWLFHKGVAAPVIGASKIEHIEQAVEALEVRLSSRDMELLEEPYRPRGIVGFGGPGYIQTRMNE